MKLRIGLLTALLALGITNAASAQVAVVVTANTDPQQIYYRYQAFLNESKTALADYQQFQLAYKNLLKGRVTNLVDVVNPLSALENDINSAMAHGKDPVVAAQLRRNTYLSQDLNMIDQLKAIVDNPNAGTAQMQQASSMLLTALLSQTMQQRTVDYAKAQDAVRRANNLQRLQDANNAATSVP